MKQTYVKPHMIVERFSLTQSIASGCGASSTSTIGKPAHWSKATCGFDVGGVLYFLNSNICEDEQLAENESIHGYCYNNPDGAMIFASN